MKPLCVLLFVVCVGSLDLTRPRDSHVRDPHGILSAKSQESVDLLIRHFRESHKADCGASDGVPRAFEIGVLLLNSLLPTAKSIEALSSDVFNEWGIGDPACNNGILFVLAKNDRKNYIRTGKGAQPFLPDRTINEILELLKPQLRDGNFDGAVETCVHEIIEHLKAGRASYFNSDDYVTMAVVALIVGSVGYGIYRSKKQAQRRKEFKAQLKRLQARREQKHKVVNETCVICLEDFNDASKQGSSDIDVLGCGHGFHVKCITLWLRKKSACPVCRASPDGTKAPTTPSASSSSAFSSSECYQQRQAAWDDGVAVFWLSRLLDDYNDVAHRGAYTDMLASSDWERSYDAYSRAQEAIAAAAAAASSSSSSSGGGCDFSGGSCDGGGGGGGDW